VGYLLRHGGDRIKEPVLRVTPQTLLKQVEGRHQVSARNSTDITCSCARMFAGTTGAADIPHFLFCDNGVLLRAARRSRHPTRSPRSCGQGRAAIWGATGWYTSWAGEGWVPCFGKDGTRQRLVSVVSGRPHQSSRRCGMESRVDTPSASLRRGRNPLPEPGAEIIDATISLQAPFFPGCLSGRLSTSFCLRESGFKLLRADVVATATLVSGPATVENTVVRDILIYDILKFIGAFTAVRGPGYSGLRDPPARRCHEPTETLQVALDFLPVRLHTDGPAGRGRC